MPANISQLYNFIQGSDITGVSSYDIWKSLNPNGTESEFLEFIRSGPPGQDGKDGESAHVYFLEASENIMKRGSDNLLLPANITFRSFYRSGASATRIEYHGRFVIQETTDGTDWITKYISNKDESSVIYTPSSVDVKIIKCRSFSAGDTTTELDNQTVVILSDASNIEIGARNLLGGSDITYTVTKDSTTVIDPINIVNGFDLQRLVGKKVTLSFYVDNTGDYTNTDNGLSESSNKFGMYSTLIWTDSTGYNPGRIVEHPIQLSYIGINKERINTTYELIPPVGYDTIQSFSFEIQLTLKPTTANNTWIFSRPKLEFGNIATDYSLAPEDIGNLVVVLSNDAHVIAANKDGSLNYEGCDATVRVYSGTNEVTNRADFVINESAGVTGYWDENNYQYIVTDLSVDTGYVDIEVTYNSITVTKRFSISKVIGAKGESTYDIWKGLGNEGGPSDFIEYLRGRSGKSAYELWLEQEGNEGKTLDEFLESLGGVSAYEIWLEQEGNAGKSVEDFFEYLQGESTYDIWKGLGYEGDARDFLEYLKGESAYELWLKQEGNAGKSEQEFLNSLKGEPGKDGNTGIVEIAELSEIILKSSTQGSTKKFRITIADDGVLTVAEVVG